VALTRLFPPAWQAAQLALKIFAPLAASPAKAGLVKANRQAVKNTQKIDINLVNTISPLQYDRLYILGENVDFRQKTSCQSFTIGQTSVVPLFMGS
jgi:hypothetical protein